jgi:hypothetical protein
VTPPVQEIDIYVALPAGAYLYGPVAHALQLTAGGDVRRVTGYQDFVDQAPLDLVYVADHGRMTLIPVASRERFASAAADAITENVYLFAAGNGLSTVIRAWINRGRARIEPRPAGAAVTDGGIPQELSQSVASAKLNAARLARCPACSDSDRVLRCSTISRCASLRRRTDTSSSTKRS